MTALKKSVYQARIHSTDPIFVDALSSMLDFHDCSVRDGLKLALKSNGVERVHLSRNIVTAVNAKVSSKMHGVIERAYQLQRHRGMKMVSPGDVAMAIKQMEDLDVDWEPLKN